MADWDLVARLLELDFLVGDELRGLDLKNELTVDVVLLALGGWALDGWIELLRVDNHVDLEPTALTCVNRNLHAWSHITCSGYDTLESDERTDVR